MKLAVSSTSLPDWRDPFWLAATSVVATAVACALFSRSYFYNVCDDSLISLQYARNFALGHGFVFNQGEYVEGFTNFLWVLFLAPLYWVSQFVYLPFERLAVMASVLFACLALPSALVSVANACEYPPRRRIGEAAVGPLPSERRQ